MGIYLWWGEGNIIAMSGIGHAFPMGMIPFKCLVPYKAQEPIGMRLKSDFCCFSSGYLQRQRHKANHTLKLASSLVQPPFCPLQPSHRGVFEFLLWAVHIARAGPTSKALPLRGCYLQSSQTQIFEARGVKESRKPSPFLVIHFPAHN